MKNLPRKITVFGASTAFGFNDSEGGFADRLHRWLFQNSTYKRSRVYKLGIARETVKQMTERVDEIFVRKTELLIFCPGGNDASVYKGRNVTSLKTYRNDLVNLFSIIKKKVERIVTITSLPVDDSKTRPLPWAKDYSVINSEKEKYNRELIELSNKYNFEILNLFEEYKNNYIKYLSDDGLHMNDAGHKMVFNQLKKLLTSQKYDR